jgi:hypothetical protein
MVSFRPKLRKRFKVRAQVITGKRKRIGVVSPGIKRARRRRGEKVGPVTTAQPSVTL